LRRRRVVVTAEGRGRAAQPRTARLWLPAAGGGIDSIDEGTVIDEGTAADEGTVIALRAG